MPFTRRSKAFVYVLRRPMLLDEAAALAIRREIEGIVAKDRCWHLVVDLSGVIIVGTAGLRLLLRLKARCEQLDRGFALCGLQPLVREVLHITNLDQVFEIYDDADVAIKALGASQTTVA